MKVEIEIPSDLLSEIRAYNRLWFRRSVESMYERECRWEKREKIESLPIGFDLFSELSVAVGNKGEEGAA